MEYDQALSRYRQDRFTDQDVTRCTDLSVRAWRELIKLKAVRTEEETYGRGPGRVRTCDAHTLKRAAVISALNKSGLSLAVAGQIAYSMPYHTLLYSVCDPLTVLFQYSAEIDPNTGLPPRLERPMADWFDPLKPAIAEPEADWLVEIFDGRFVGVRYDARKGPVTIFGDLREQATRFIGWLPFPRRDQFAGGAIERMAQEVRGPGFIKFIARLRRPVQVAQGTARFGLSLRKSRWRGRSPLRCRSNPLFVVQFSEPLSTSRSRSARHCADISASSPRSKLRVGESS